MAALARDKELGRVVGLRTLRLGWGNPHDVDAAWIFLPHELAIGLEILGELPTSTSAVADVVDGNVVGILGLMGDDPWHALEVSTRSAERRREVRLLCEEGVAVLPDPYSDHIEIFRRTELAEQAAPEPELRPTSTELPLLRELPRLYRAPRRWPTASQQRSGRSGGRTGDHRAAFPDGRARVMLAATVLVPTHDHGPTLRRSIATALAQTVSDLEVLVVGDGVPDVTRELMAELTSADQRVRFFDNPKGARHGEEHRHAALSEARGEIVCYLSDDDLWLPEHVETLQALLAESDFAHTLPLWIDPDGSIHHWRVDLELPFYRELLLGGENRVPHCCVGHTLELYQRLPAGWRAGPEEIPSDLHMWQQILSVPGCRAASGTRATALHFPSRQRSGWSSTERLDELDAWTARVRDRAWRDGFPQQVLDAVAVEDARLDDELAAREERLQEQVARLAELHEQVLAQQEELLTLQEEQARLVASLLERERDLALLSSSVTWRLRERVVRLGALSAPIRWAARALARPAARGETGSTHPGPKPEETGPAS